LTLAEKQRLAHFSVIFLSVWGGLGDGRVVAAVWLWLPRMERGAQHTRIPRITLMPTSRPLPVLRADRVRRPPRSFAWLDHRLRSGSFLAQLTADEIALYCFLALAGDALGLSCWRLDRIERELPLDVSALRCAREGLLRADLIAFQPWHAHCPDGSYQVLALPTPAPAPQRGNGPLAIGEVLSGFGGLCR
jgi:hypothetical protein